MSCPHDSDEMWTATDAGLCPLCQRAEIERLQTENAALRSDNLRQWAALTEMASLNLFAHQYRNRARAALAGEEGT